MRLSRAILACVLLIAIAAILRLASQGPAARPKARGTWGANGAVDQGASAGPTTPPAAPMEDTAASPTFAGLPSATPSESARPPASPDRTGPDPRGSAHGPDGDAADLDAPPYEGAPDTVGSSDATGTSETRLPARGTTRIFGTVLGKDGLPVQLVLVTVLREEDGGSVERKPDANGKYEVRSLAGGTYQVTCAVRGEAVFSRRVGLAEGEERRIDFSVQSGARLFGQVSRGGRAVAEVQISFAPEHGADVTATYAQTDAQGNYEIRGVPPGAVLGRVGRHDHRIWIPEGVQELRYDFALPEGILAGRVYEGRERRPAQAASIDLYRAGDPRADLSQHAARWVTGTLVDAEGRYELVGVKGGEYWLHVTHEKHGTTIHGPVRLEERGAQEGIDIYLGNPGMIAGFVRDEGGQPIEGATATLREAKTREPVRPRGDGVATNQNGMFLIEGIPPGDYRVTVHARGKAKQSRNVRTSDGLERAEFILPAEGFVRVRVKDASGAPVEHAVLVVWDALGEPVDPAPGDWDDPSRVQTGVDGVLTRGGLPSGAYRGEVASAFGRAIFDFSVVEEETTEIEVTVQPVPREER